MKLTISKDTLLEQLNHVVGAVERKQTSKILENVLIQVTNEKLKLVGTDLEIEMSATLDINTGTEGQITAPAHKLLDICKALPPDCFISLETDDNNRLHLKGERSKFELVTLPADDFPILDDIPIKEEITIPESALKKLLDKVSFSMATQDVRYYLNGMFLVFADKQLTAVTTDGHRLGISNFSGLECSQDDLQQKIIVPRKGILELSRLLDASSELPVTLQISDNHIRITKNQIRFTSKLIDGKYPDYQAAIPSSCNYSIELEREKFKDTLARVAILSNEKFRGIKLLFNDGTMFLHSNNPDNESAEEEIDINYTQDVLEIGFNVTYLLEAINHLEGDTIKLDLTAADISALLYSTDDLDTKYVVMPIRI